VTSYQVEVQNADWIDVSIGAAESNMKLNKKVKSEYAFVKYGPHGNAYKNKILELKNRGLQCVFSYQIAGGMTASTYTKFLTGTNNPLWIGSSNDRRMLIWAENNEVFLQGFDNFNIHTPIKIQDSLFITICLNHFNDVISEKIKPRILKHSEQNRIEIIIPQNAESRYVKRFDYDDINAPQQEFREGLVKAYDLKYPEALKVYQQNSQTYLAKLIPVLQFNWFKLFIPEQSF
jgi:hypothetical protein